MVTGIIATTGFFAARKIAQELAPIVFSAGKGATSEFIKSFNSADFSNAKYMASNCEEQTPFVKKSGIEAFMQAVLSTKAIDTTGVTPVRG